MVLEGILHATAGERKTLIRLQTSVCSDDSSARGATAVVAQNLRE